MKLHIATLIALSVMALFGSSIVAQENQTQTNEELSTERCALAQNYLDTIQKPRDLRTRVDRLQAYLYIYQRFDMFTIRLERNDQPRAKEMRAVLDSFGKNTDAFKINYELYDEARDAVVAVKNCRNNIEEFRQKLNTARDKRQAVNANVVAIESIFDPGLKSQLDILQESLSSNRSGGSDE